MIGTGAEPAHREFELCVKPLRDRLFNYAYRITGNREDAEDLTQEACCRAYSSFGKYDRTRPFEKWFFRILKNLFIDKLRINGKHQAISLDQPLSNGDYSYLLEIPDRTTDPEMLMMDQIIDKRLVGALSSLPERFRRVVLLRDVERLSYEEIAREIGAGIGTVRSRIHRGREKIRARMRTLDPATYPTQKGSRN